YGSRLDKEVSAVSATLDDGDARHDVWKKDDEGKLLELAVAPIRGDQGQIVGSLLVGYDLSNGLASSEGKRVGGRDVAFLVDEKVYSSSLNESLVKPLKGYLFGGAKAMTTAAMAGQTSTPWVAEVGSADFVGVLAPLPSSKSA